MSQTMFLTEVPPLKQTPVLLEYVPQPNTYPHGHREHSVKWGDRQRSQLYVLHKTEHCSFNLLEL